MSDPEKEIKEPEQLPLFPEFVKDTDSNVMSDSFDQKMEDQVIRVLLDGQGIN